MEDKEVVDTNEDEFEKYKNMPNFVMGKKKSFFRRHILDHKIKLSIIVFISLILVLLQLIPNKFNILDGYLNGFFIAGVFDICIGGLMFTTNNGVFDGISYGFGRMFAKSDSEGQVSYKYKNLNNYIVSKSQKRNANKYANLPWFFIGSIFLIISIILYIIYINNAQIIEELLFF